MKNNRVEIKGILLVRSQTEKLVEIETKIRKFINSLNLELPANTVVDFRLNKKLKTLPF